MANFSDYNWNKENNEQKLSEQDLEKLIDKYSELDNDTLMKEFLKITLEKKKQGQLSDSELSVLKIVNCNSCVIFFSN